MRLDLILREQIAQQRPDVCRFVNIHPLRMVILNTAIRAQVGMGGPVVAENVSPSAPARLDEILVKGAFAQNFETEKHRELLIAKVKLLIGGSEVQLRGKVRSQVQLGNGYFAERITAG